MIIGDVIPNQGTQMRLVRGEDMVEKLVGTAFNPALSDSLLAMTSVA
jgi:hypothetical protein